jgi:hypothetical protein
MAKLRPFGTRVRSPDQIRDALYAAGWKPTMAFGASPHPDPEIHRLLLELNQANVMLTQRRMREQREKV